MKMLKISLIAIVVLIILGLSSLAVDRYLYSWTSYLQPFGCAHKHIRANSSEKKLAQEYDLVAIGEKLKHNNDYTFGSWNNERRLFVSRTFGDVKYHIYIEKYTTSEGSFTKIRFSNSPKATRGLNDVGESPRTPDRLLLMNAYEMIDDMPLNKEQKGELKEKVTVICAPTTRFTF